MSTSAFGIDHGLISKATDPNTGKKPSGGRRALAAYNPGLHSIVAGKKGKKLRSYGNEAGGSALGALAGGGAGLLASRKNPIPLAVGAVGGSIAGSQAGLNRNQRKGYLKPEGQ